MRTLVFREHGTWLSRAVEQGTCHAMASAGIRIRLLDGTNNQRTNGGAEFPGAPTKRLMQRLRHIDRRTAMMLVCRCYRFGTVTVMLRNFRPPV
jgi:hypothetical protein